MGFCHNVFGWGGWMGMGGGWLGMILNVALLAGVLALLGLATVWFARQFRHTKPAAETLPDPLAIAQRRLAAGEITVSEFEEIRSWLRS